MRSPYKSCGNFNLWDRSWYEREPPGTRNRLPEAGSPKSVILTIQSTVPDYVALSEDHTKMVRIINPTCRWTAYRTLRALFTRRIVNQRFAACSGDFASTPRNCCGIAGSILWRRLRGTITEGIERWPFGCPGLGSIEIVRGRKRVLFLSVQNDTHPNGVNQLPTVNS
jgi:hypothetical protein